MRLSQLTLAGIEGELISVAISRKLFLDSFPGIRGSSSLTCASDYEGFAGISHPASSEGCADEGMIGW